MKRILAVLLSLPLLGGPASAYPDRPMTMIVPLPAGGPSDAIARSLSEAMGRALGQPVVVENRPGADGAVGTRAAIAAPADGHTLLYAIGSLVGLPHLVSPPPFDMTRDLKPVASIGRFPFAMSIHPAVPAASVAEFVGYAKVRSTPLFYAASTAGETLAAVQFMKATGVAMTRVPYKGSAQAIPDLLSGRVQVMFGPAAAVQQAAEDGRLRLLAAVAPQRIAALPALPTMAEAGVAGIAVPTWQAVLAPAGTPDAITARVAEVIAAALAQTELRDRLARTSLQIEPLGPAALGDRIRADGSLWAELARDPVLKTQ